MCGALRTLAIRVDKALRVVFALGGPGAGKGTVCQLLCARHGWLTLSAGALLRAEAENDVVLAEGLAAGRVVPPERSAAAVLRALGAVPPETRVVLVDGFPRDAPAARLWDSVVSERKVCAFVLEVSNETLRRRLGDRGRIDDVEDVVMRRLEYHNQQTPELQRYLGERAVSVSADATPDEVADKVQRILELSPFFLPHRLDDAP